MINQFKRYFVFQDAISLNLHGLILILVYSVMDQSVDKCFFKKIKKNNTMSWIYFTVIAIQDLRKTKHNLFSNNPSFAFTIRRNL